MIQSLIKNSLARTPSLRSPLEGDGHGNMSQLKLPIATDSVVSVEPPRCVSEDGEGPRQNSILESSL